MHLDSHIVKTNDGQETAFTSIMGHMDVIKFIAGGFNVYLPMLMCIFCLATFLEIGSRFLHFMGIEQFILDDEMTADLIKDGSDLVKRERNKRQKLIDGRTRRLAGAAGASRESSSAQLREVGAASSSRSGDHHLDADEANASSTSRREHMTRGNSSESARLELLGSETENIQSYSTLQHQPNRNIFDDL